jgi:hypothetical protein
MPANRPYADSRSDQSESVDWQARAVALETMMRLRAEQNAKTISDLKAENERLRGAASDESRP